MDDWDSQKMLDLYIHDYMATNNMHTSAENFAKEAGVILDDVEINPPEGFLTDWWSLFWSMYCNTVETPRRHETLEESSSKETTRNVNPTKLRPEFRHMLNICPEIQRSDPNILPGVGPSWTTPRPDMINLLHGISPEMNQNALLKRASPGLNQDEFGHYLIKGFNTNHGQPMPNFISGTVGELELPRFPAMNSMSNSQLPNIAQLAQMLTSSSNFSQSQQQISKKRRLEVDGDGTRAKKYKNTEPGNGTAEPQEPKIEHSDHTGSSTNSSSNSSSTPTPTSSRARAPTPT